MGDSVAEIKITVNQRTENETTLESGIEKIALDGSKAENDTAKANESENETVDANEGENGSREKETTNKRNVKKDSVHRCMFVEKSRDKTSAGEHVAENVIEVECECGGAYRPAISPEMQLQLRKCRCFAENSYRVLKLYYDKLKGRTSDIQQESINLPVLCGPPFAAAIYRYDPEGALAKYSDIAHGENRETKLKDAMHENMRNIGNNKADSEFLLHVALDFYAAFDLKERGFEKAPECAIEAFADALHSTDQYELVDKWEISDDELIGIPYYY